MHRRLVGKSGSERDAREAVSSGEMTASCCGHRGHPSRYYVIPPTLFKHNCGPSASFTSPPTPSVASGPQRVCVAAAQQSTHVSGVRVARSMEQFLLVKSFSGEKKCCFGNGSFTLASWGYCSALPLSSPRAVTAVGVSILGQHGIVFDLFYGAIPFGHLPEVMAHGRGKPPSRSPRI